MEQLQRVLRLYIGVAINQTFSNFKQARFGTCRFVRFGEHLHKRSCTLSFSTHLSDKNKNFYQLLFDKWMEDKT
jgi:hypothetical protein